MRSAMLLQIAARDAVEVRFLRDAFGQSRQPGHPLAETRPGRYVRCSGLSVVLVLTASQHRIGWGRMAGRASTPQRNVIAPVRSYRPAASFGGPIL